MIDPDWPLNLAHAAALEVRVRAPMKCDCPLCEEANAVLNDYWRREVKKLSTTTTSPDA